MIIPNEYVEFIDYVMSFYGPEDPVYDLGFEVTRPMVWTALLTLLTNNSDFEGDSIDRERVRDLMIRFNA